MVQDEHTLLLEPLVEAKSEIYTVPYAQSHVLTRSHVKQSHVGKFRRVLRVHLGTRHQARVPGQFQPWGSKFQEVVAAPCRFSHEVEVPQVRPGHGARVGMFSARFDGGEIEQRFRRIHEILAQSGYDIMMVGVHPGETFGVPTTRYLGRLYRERGVMLCVCTEHYGEMTSSHFSSFEELIFAKTYEAFIKIVPLRMGAVYPPMPPGRGANGPNRPDHLDEHLDGQSFATSVFNPARLYLDCREKSDVEIAAAIAECLHH